VFIFAYNEESTIGIVVDQTMSILKDITSDYEVIIIDDASTDNTATAAQQAAQRHAGVRLVRHPVNLGIGETLADGYRQATKQVVCGIPGDGEFVVECLREGAPALNEADIVSFYRCGNRVSRLRRMLSFAHRRLNQLLLGLDVRDVNWVKLYKRWVVAEGGFHSQSPLLETELLATAKQRGARIVELPCPVRLRSHRGGAGMWGTLQNGVSMTKELLRLFFRLRLSNNVRKVK
jgi:glycosyltransferase involved in cell wall biosynthesis